MPAKRARDPLDDIDLDALGALGDVAGLDESDDDDAPTEELFGSAKQRVLQQRRDERTAISASRQAAVVKKQQQQRQQQQQRAASSNKQPKPAAAAPEPNKAAVRQAVCKAIGNVRVVVRPAATAIGSDRATVFARKAVRQLQREQQQQLQRVPRIGALQFAALKSSGRPAKQFKR
eukprot:TRINITY_DN1068_c0_g5_i1.p2 TRINITY_DN1068_c0_g5~~TRINITY_DN1068_c0_g5_i1.p2  ORF type:complete len:176 (+),score=90.45 TRINITY_DN1068_c0_g5_i1:129-656(+)